jgi:AcrR family transcriptional regulator
VRDRIYETAIELFLEKGYEGTSLDEIADRADVARATVFNHFSRKSEFLGEWGFRRRAQVANSLRDGHLDDVSIEVFFVSYMRVMADLNVTHRAETKEMMALGLPMALRSSPMNDLFASRIHGAQLRGEIKEGVDPGQVGAMLAAMYFSTIIRWVDHDPPEFDLAETLVSSVHLLLHGIETPRDGAQ